MKSLEIALVKKQLTDYLTELNMCAEVKRMIVKEIYEEISRKASEEIILEADTYNPSDKEEESNG